MLRDVLFRPFNAGGLSLANRVVMAPMTRCFSPHGVPGENVAAYYRRRAENGVGLILTEGTWIPHPSASNEETAPRFYGQDALAGWARVVKEVHEAGGKIAPQLWHVGLSPKPKAEVYKDETDDHTQSVSPSGYITPGAKVAEPMTDLQIAAIIGAYAEAAASAQRLGFDGVEIHGAHGYLIDQFFWGETNKRTDSFGGDLIARTRFACEIVRAMRNSVGPDFPIILRYSQWKLIDYAARMIDNPATLERFLAPLVDAGVDVFHCSQRRFWEPEFADSALNLAGWTKKLSGKPVISVGSVGLDTDLLGMGGEDVAAGSASFDKLLVMMERGDFDMIAIGRALIANPDWADRVRRGEERSLKAFSPEQLAELI
ncbi:MAG: NADH:flavin oxidoreductase [Caulobacterales bacterium]